MRLGRRWPPCCGVKWIFSVTLPIDRVWEGNDNWPVLTRGEPASACQPARSSVARNMHRIQLNFETDAPMIRGRAIIHQRETSVAAANLGFAPTYALESLGRLHSC